MRGNAVPDFAELQDYSVNRSGEYEVTRQSLYDFQTYAALGQSSLTFFLNPQGQGGRTLDDTNMEAAGTLPNPKNFVVQSIEIHLFPADAPVSIANPATDLATITNFSNDVEAVGESGVLDFFIGSKSYLTEAPLVRFPPKTRLHTEFGFGLSSGASAATGSTAQVSGDYAAFCGRPYNVNPWIMLAPQQNFKVTLSWATPVAVSADARIGVVLDGLLYRLSQ